MTILTYKSLFLSYVPTFTQVLHISVHQWNSESITVCKIPLLSRTLGRWSPLRPPSQSRNPQPAVSGPPPAKLQRRQDRRSFRQNGWASKDLGTLHCSKPVTGDETGRNPRRREGTNGKSPRSHAVGSRAAQARGVLPVTCLQPLRCPRWCSDSPPVADVVTTAAGTGFPPLSGSISKKHSGTRPNADQLLPNQGHTSHLHLLAIMVTSSEVLLIIKKMLPKEAGRSSLLMAERIAWAREGKDRFTVNHMYADIKCISAILRSYVCHIC